MRTANFLTSSCRYCRHYQPEGRRGGMCSQLGVEVQAGWKACSLAIPPFTSSQKRREEIVLLENSLSLNMAKDCSELENCEKQTLTVVEK